MSPYTARRSSGASSSRLPQRQAAWSQPPAAQCAAGSCGGDFACLCFDLRCLETDAAPMRKGLAFCTASCEPLPLPPPHPPCRHTGWVGTAARSTLPRPLSRQRCRSSLRKISQAVLARRRAANGAPPQRATLRPRRRTTARPAAHACAAHAWAPNAFWRRHPHPFPPCLLPTGNPASLSQQQLSPAPSTPTHKPRRHGVRPAPLRRLHRLPPGPW